MNVFRRKGMMNGMIITEVGVFMCLGIIFISFIAFIVHQVRFPKGKNRKSIRFK
jgi:hypothetical protein